MGSFTNGNGHSPKSHGSEGPGDAAQQFLVEAQKILLPILAREISDTLLRPGEKIELKKQVVEVIDGWLTREKVPIGRQLRLKLIEVILAGMERGGSEQPGTGA